MERENINRCLGGLRCVYLSSIRFSSIIENWKLKSISVHPDWFHLKQNVKNQNQNWNKHFWSFNLRKITVKGLVFIFPHFLLKQNRKAAFLFRFSYFLSKPNLEITTITEKSIGVTNKSSSHWMKIKHTTPVRISRESKCSFQFWSSMKIKNWKTVKKPPRRGRCACTFRPFDFHPLLRIEN